MSVPPYAHDPLAEIRKRVEGVTKGKDIPNGASKRYIVRAVFRLLKFTRVASPQSSLSSLCHGGEGLIQIGRESEEVFMAISLKLAGVSASIMLAKAFKVEEGTALATEIVSVVGDLAGRRVVVVDHPPTAGLVPLLEGLVATGAEVHLRDHHGDADRDGSVVAACRALLGERAVVVTRVEHPACSTLVGMGEFRDDVVVADVDQDGLTAALKAVGVSYPELDADAAVLDGPHTGKTAEALSPLGFTLVRAWGAIPAFGDRTRDSVVANVATAFAAAVAGDSAGVAELDRLAVEYERKVKASKELAKTATEPFRGFRIVAIPAGTDFDPPTLAGELDRGVLVSGRVVATGPIAGKPGGFGTQVSLARTKAGETAGIDLAKLADECFGPRPEAGWGPADGVISNTPFLLHLSPERWDAFQPVLEAALAG